jgi:iron(III) transport system permease protein
MLPSNAQAGLRWIAGAPGLLLLLAALGLLVAMPLLTVLYASFIDTPPFSSSTSAAWSLANYAEAWSPEMRRALGNTALIGVGGTAVAVLIGGLLGWLYARTDVPGKKLVYLSSVMPLFISLVVASITWTLLASGRSGYLNVLMGSMGIGFRFDIRSLTGLVFVEGIYYAPYPFLLISTALALINPDLEEAALQHGAGMLQVVRRVVLPLVAPAVIGAVLLVLTLIVEDFPTASILGGPVGIETVAVRIYNLITVVPSQPNRASAVSVLLTLLVCILVFAQRRLLAGRDVRTITGKGARPRQITLGALRLPALLLVLVYGFVVVVLPLLALVEASLHDAAFIRNASSLVDSVHLSGARFAAVLGNAVVGRAAINTLLAAMAAAFGGTILVFIVAYLVERTRLPGRQMLEYLVMAPSAVPSLVIGLGLLWMWVAVPLPVYGTLWVLILAFITRFLPQGYRAVAATIGQVHPDLEQSALICGATRFTAVRRIILPLVRPGVAAAAFLILILSFRELTAALFLYTTNTRVLSVVIFEQYQNGALGEVAATSLLYTFFLFLLALMTRRWLGAGT